MLFKVNKNLTTTASPTKVLESNEDSLSNFESLQTLQDGRVIVKGMKRRIFATALVPTAILLLIISFAVWQSVASRKSDPTALDRSIPYNEVETSKLPVVPSFSIASPVDEIVFNERVSVNGALVVSPSLQPTQAVTGQIYYDSTKDSLRMFDGTNYRQVVSISDEDQICFQINNCGYARISDIPSIPDIPDAVTLPQDLAVTASPTFAGLTLSNDLSVSNGGTGRSSFADNAVLLGAGSGAISVTNTPLSGQLLIGNTSGVPQFVSLSGDATVTSSGVINLSANSVDATELTDTTVTAGTYGSVTEYPVFTVDADGRITNASTLAVPGGGSGVGSLNALVGALTLQGTSNQVNVVSGGSTITLSTPQDIASTSSPTFNGLTLTSLLIGGDTLTELAGTGLAVNAGSLETTLGLSIDGSEITNGSVANADLANSSLTVSAGTGLTGGGAVSLGGTVTLNLANDFGSSIDSSEITNGTILFADLSDNGCGSQDVIKWNGSAWTCAADSTGSGTNTFATISAPSGTSPVADSTSDTLTLLNGAGVSITGNSTTDEITIAAVLGADVSGSEIVDGTIEEVDLEATNAATDNYVLTFDSASGGFTWVDPTTVGLSYDFDITDGTTTQTLSNGDVFTFVDGSNIDAVVTATDTVTINLSSTPTISGLTTLNGGLTIQAGDNFIFNGDTLTDLTGTGLTLNGTTLEATLGTAIDTSEITNATILFADIAQNGCSNDEVIKWNGSAWVCGTDSTGSGTNTFGTISTPAGTSPVADSTTDTLTLADGAGITITGNSTTDTVTIAAVLGADINLASAEVTGTLAVTNGGTGATSTQGAINALSQLTTNGDLLYYNGTNSTRLARGGNGDCLTSNGTTIVWAACGGGSGTGANTSLSNLSGVAINTSLLTGAGTVDLGSDVSAFRDAYLSSTIILEGSSANGFETTLAVADPTADRTITFPNDTGTVCLSSGNCAGVGGTGDILNSGQNGTVRVGSNDANSVILESNNIDRLTIDSTGAASFSGTLAVTGTATFTDLITANGGLTVQAGDTFTFNGDAFTDLTGTGLSIVSGSLQTTLGTDISLTTEVTGTLPVANGGTGSANAQGAIDNISGLTTNGDLLYFNGTNSTRLARGTNGQCLTANSTTLVWTSCAGTGTTFFTLSGSTGTSQSINGGDTLTIAAGSSGNVTSVASATDTVTLDIISNPTFSGLVTMQAGATISNGQTLTVGGEGFTDLTGTGLTMSGGALQSTLGTDIIGSEIANGTIEAVDFESTNAPGAGVDNYVLTYDNATGGFTWVDPTTVGVSYSFTVTDGSTPQTISNTDTLTVVDGTNINVVTSATDTLTVNLVNNPTLSGLVTLNGGLTIQAGDTFTFNGDAFTDLTGTGLTINTGVLEATLGTAIDTSEITNATILFADIAQNGCSNDEVIKWNGSAWVCGTDSTGSGTNTFGTISTPAGTSPVADSTTDTLTLADGAGITITGNSTTDTVTIAAVLGADINLASAEVTGTLAVTNGGTGATSTQGAINALSQLTTNGDLLYFNGSNSTRLGRGSNGQCLQSDSTTILWTTCAGSGTTFFSVAGTSGTPQNINGGDTLTIAAGSNITTTAGATDTLTVAVTSSPTFSGDLTVQGNTTIGNATTDRITFTSQVLGGSPLVFQGTTDNGFETTLAVADPAADRTITLPDADGTVCLTSGNCAGVGGTGDILNNGQNGTVRIGSNNANSTILESNGTDRLTIDSTGAANFTGNLSVDTSTFYVDAASDFVAIGSTSAANSRLNVASNAGASDSGSIIQASGTLGYTTGAGELQYAFKTFSNVTPTSAANGTYFGGVFGPQGTSTTNLTNATIGGVYGLGTYTGTSGTLDKAVGGRFTVQNSGNGTGIIDEAFGVQIVNFSNPFGTINDRAGLQIDAFTTAFTDATLVLLGTNTIPTGDFSIYNASAQDNVFQGNLAVGSTTAPTVALDVTGAGIFSGNLTVNGNTTLGNAVTDNLTVTSAIQGANALIFDGATDNTNEITLAITDPGADFTITLPAETGTICTSGNVCSGYAASSGSGNYIQNQSGSDQSADFRISGTGRANTSLTAPIHDALSGGSLSLGTSNATGVTIGGTTNTTAIALQGATAATYTIGTGTGTGTITVGQSTATNIINIGTAAGSGGTQTINIGTSATASSTTNVSIGSTVGGTTTLRGNVAVSNLSSSGSTIICRNGSNYLSTCLSTPLYGSLTDNITDAFQVRESTNDYINIYTTNTAEAIRFGNTVTNPDYTFLGNGAMSTGGYLTVGDALSVTNNVTVSGNLVFDNTGGIQSSTDLSITPGGGDLFITGNLDVSANTTFNGNNTLGDTSADLLTINAIIQGTNALIFEGSSADANETTLAVVNPTADVTYQLPAASAGTYDICTSANNCTSLSGYIVQVPTSTAQNTITPTAASVVGLTVNGTSGTAATAVNIVQGGAANALAVSGSSTTATNTAYINPANASGTVTNGLNVDKTGAGTVTNLVNLNVSAGTATYGLTFSGGFGTSVYFANGSGSLGTTSGGSITAQAGTGGLNLNTASIGGSTTSGSVAIASGAQLSTGASGQVTLQSGQTSNGNSGALTIGTGLVSSSGTSGAISITTGQASTAGNITINNGNSLSGGAPNIDIGTGANARDIAIGNTATGSDGSTVLIQGGITAGSGTAVSIQAASATRINIGTTNSNIINLGTSNGSESITLGGTSQTGSIVIGQSNQGNTISIGSAATMQNQDVQIANGGISGSSNSVKILSGGAAVAGASTIDIGDNDRLTQIDIGNIVNDVARTINIFTGNSTDVDTINIGTGATTAAGGKTVNIATGAPTGSGTNLVTIGNATATTVALQGNVSVPNLSGTTGATFVCRNASNYLSTCSSTPLTNSLNDGVADAFDLQEGTNNYININTTNSSENISFGNATTNPSYSFLGTGTVTLAGDLAVNGDDITSDGNLTVNATGYVRIGDTGTPGVASGDDDLYVESDLEVDATATIAGNLTVSGLQTLDSSGNSGINHISIRNSNAGSSATGGIQFGQDTSAAVSYIFQNSTTNTSWGGVNSMNFVNTFNASMLFATNSTTRLYITGGGDAYWNGTASTSQFEVRDGTSSTVTLLVADSSNDRVYVGDTTGDTTGTVLVLDTKTDSGDPTGVAGAMYYNSNSNSFRCYTTAWTACDTTGAGSSKWVQDDGADYVYMNASGYELVVGSTSQYGGNKMTVLSTNDADYDTTLAVNGTLTNTGTDTTGIGLGINTTVNPGANANTGQDYVGQLSDIRVNGGNYNGSTIAIGHKLYSEQGNGTSGTITSFHSIETSGTVNTSFTVEDYRAIMLWQPNENGTIDSNVGLQIENITNGTDKANILINDGTAISSIHGNWSIYNASSYDNLFGGKIIPNAAGTIDLGSTTAEFDELYVADDSGIVFGLDQDATLGYDETGDDRVELTGTRASLFIEDRLQFGVDARTIADNGNGGTPATLSLEPSSSYVEVTCNDAQTCDITMAETASIILEGHLVVITNLSTNSVDFADTAGVTELTGAVALGQYDTITLIYSGDRWIQVSASNN